jgi:hypothetical protein
VLNKDFKEFIDLLNHNRVEYLIVGGYALAFHGHPRYTKDLDVWIRCTPENADKLLRALESFGFASLELSAQDFLEPGSVIQLGYPPQRIDLLTQASGVDFDTCYAAKIEITLDGTPVNFIDLANLKKNKHATGRLQDLADLEQLGD